MNPKLAPLLAVEDWRGLTEKERAHRKCAELAPHIDALIEAASEYAAAVWGLRNRQGDGWAARYDAANAALTAALAFFQEGSESDEAIATQARHDPAPSQDAPAG